MSNRLLEIKKVLSACNDCIHCDAFSVDCKAHAFCRKAGKHLPADGKAGTEIMYMPIPKWCPLPKTKELPTDNYPTPRPRTTWPKRPNQPLPKKQRQRHQHLKLHHPLLLPFNQLHLAYQKHCSNTLRSMKYQAYCGRLKN